jgi:flagellar biosynthetic protein FlhB
LYGGRQQQNRKSYRKKRQDERKKGNIFQSKDAVSAVSILAIFFTLKICFPYIYAYLSNFLKKYIAYVKSTNTLTQLFAMDVLKDCVIAVLVLAGPVMLMSILVAVLATGVQTKFKFSGEQLKFKFNRISLIEGFKRLFSLRSIVELVKAMIKIAIITVVLYTSFTDISTRITSLMSVDVMEATKYILNSIMDIVIKLSVVFLVLAAGDYFYQWWEYERNIRMSKQEVKEEYKQMEGDPQIKGRIKERQRAMSQKRMMQQVPTADVIVRNPTHFAVALKYDIERNTAPIVVAKGQDHIALKIVEIAEAHHIPMKEDKPLARALYAAVEVNMEIPPEFYAVLAEIMAWVYTMKKEDK